MGRRSGQFEQRDDGIANERLDARPPLAKETPDVDGAAVAEPDPDDLGRRALQNAEPVKVLVLRDQYGPEVNGALPHDVVSRTAEAKQADVDPIRGQIPDVLHEGFRQLLVEEQPHG